MNTWSEDVTDLAEEEEDVKKKQQIVFFGFLQKKITNKNMQDTE